LDPIPLETSLLTGLIPTAPMVRKTHHPEFIEGEVKLSNGVNSSFSAGFI